MEYKSELIDFEKEDMKSKKRMLGSDKVTIEEIKERVGLRAHMKTLCNAPKFEGTINYNDAEDDVVYLLSIVEQADKAFRRLQSKAYVGSHDEMLHEINVEIEALQAIRK